MKKLTQLTLATLSLAFITACSDNDDTPYNDSENINEVKLMITEQGTDESHAYSWANGQADTIVLDASKLYDVSISFYDVENGDREDETPEIIEETNAHYVFYNVQQADLAIENATNDIKDSEQNSIGINTMWTSTATSTGSVQLFLIHSPTTKTGSTRTDFGGEDDVNITFPVVIN